MPCRASTAAVAAAGSWSTITDSGASRWAAAPESRAIRPPQCRTSTVPPRSATSAATTSSGSVRYWSKVRAYVPPIAAFAYSTTFMPSETTGPATVHSGSRSARPRDGSPVYIAFTTSASSVSRTAVLSASGIRSIQER